MRWFPKLTCGVGGRVWSCDGEIERTVGDRESAAGSPLAVEPGATTLSDAQIDALFEQMGAADYNPEEYDSSTGTRHFVDDASQRPESDGVDESCSAATLAESESLLVESPASNLTRRDAADPSLI